MIGALTVLGIGVAATIFTPDTHGAEASPKNNPEYKEKTDDY